jgi:phage major head subunit gpT-like protein
MLINHGNLVRLFTGYKANFQRGWELVTPMHPTVSMRVPSSTEIEEYDWLGVAPGMREWLGDRVIESLGSHGFTIKNRDWEQTIGVERNKIEDDRFGVYNPLFQRMGEAAALHKDELIFGDLVNNGGAADHLGYDGVSFFGATHPHEVNGTVSNVDTGGGGPYWYLADFSSVLRPFIDQDRKAPQFVAKNAITDDNVFYRKEFHFGVDARYNVGYGLWQYIFRSNQTLSESNYESLYEAMLNQIADNGKPLNVNPTTIIVPNVLWNDARRLFSQGILAAGESNIHQGEVTILRSPHLANT